MDMKKILQAIDNASTEVSSSEMQRLRNIVEGKGPLNRLTAAESMTVDHYSALRTTITSPVLNVQEDARPSMIGKYFKTVEEELQESAQQGNLRTRQLAERVTTRLNELSTATLASYKKKAGADASKADKEGDFKRGDKRFSGIVKATKKQFANDEQGVAEGNDTNELTASVTVDGEFKEFDLTPFIAKNNWVGTPQQVIKLAEKWLSDFLRKKGLAYSNLKITYKGMTLNANQIGDVGSSEFESVAEGERTMSRAAKGYEKYGKAGMTALAKAGREGAGEKKLDAIRDRHDNYNEDSDPCWDSHKMVGTKKKGGKPVPNCVPKESVKEDTKRCMQCGMTNCSCKPGKCKCKPIAGWIPNKGFKKAVDEAANAAQQAAIAIAKKKAGKK